MNDATLKRSMINGDADLSGCINVDCLGVANHTSGATAAESRIFDDRVRDGSRLGRSTQARFTGRLRRRKRAGCTARAICAVPPGKGYAWVPKSARRTFPNVFRIFLSAEVPCLG